MYKKSVNLFFLMNLLALVLAQLDSRRYLVEQLKTQKVAGDVHHHLVMNESDYGTYLGLRPVEQAKPERNAECFKRQSDNKFACYPDVIYIGTSKSGTTSTASHLAHHPMLQNILSRAESAKRKSKEGHFWEYESISKKRLNYNIADMTTFINTTKMDILELQEGFTSLENRPILIEYSPNYFVLDQVPQLLKQEFNYRLKFIVSLRDPISRAISSWKFKANEGLKLQALRKARKETEFPDDYFNVTMGLGMEQAKCISECYEKHKSMKVKISLSINYQT
jgi:hypothetical protein